MIRVSGAGGEKEEHESQRSVVEHGHVPPEVRQ
jgi:hypothetical protein